MLKKSLALLLTCILIVLLFAHVPVVVSERVTDTLWPIGHIVSFAFWAWLLLSFNAHVKSSTSKRQIILLLLITLIIGGGIELIQPIFSRSAQLSDLYYNLFGALAGYLFFGNFKKSKKWLFIFRALYIILFLYLIFPALQTLKDEYETRMDFPIIAKFDSLSELTRWKADLPLSIVNSSDLVEITTVNTNLMQVTFAEEKASRVVLRFFAGDWTGYEKIKFSFFNPNQDVLKVRLIITDHIYNQSHSDQNDRFGKWLMLNSGWSEHYVDLTDIKNAPTERVMDLSNIAGVDFYMYQLHEPIKLFLSKIELISAH
jgi:VanZ family protein